MRDLNRWSLIGFTLFMAVVLTLLPMPNWAIWARPAWVLLVLIYWSIMAPHRVNIGVAWVMGIILDVLCGTLLGEHAFALVIVTFFVVRMHNQLRVYPALHQSMWVLVFVVIYQFILFCIQGFLGDAPKTLLYWSSSFTSMIIWPWISMMIRDQQRRHRTSM